jgi:hypothetical protein
MVTGFDLDEILYRVLSGSEGLMAAISGGIYLMERPDNSESEDITIGTLAVTRNYLPQTATSNVNVYVPDLRVNIGGQEQRVIADRRLRALADTVISVLETATVEGLSFWIANQTVIREQGIYQHYVNLRVGWNIALES